jgi:SAM-dependent methyltransferase
MAELPVLWGFAEKVVHGISRSWQCPPRLTSGACIKQASESAFLKSIMLFLLQEENMKTRESGMPDERMWEEFFDPESIMESLGIRNIRGNVADFGCGYGTFTIPAARRTKGIVYAIDVEAEMVRVTREKAGQNGLGNVIAIERDFLALGSGLPESSCDYVMLFNILHAEDPLAILAEVRRILHPDGRVGIIHWNYDDTTPRGPSMAIRPKPQQCKEWLIEAGYEPAGPIIDLPPYHYGLVGIKKSESNN